MWILFKKILIIYFWLCWVFISVHRLSVAVMSEGCFLVSALGLLTAVASPGAEHGLWTSRDRAWWLWRVGLVALWHVESSWTRDWTRVPCIRRYILNHWTMREAWLVDSELWHVGSGSLTSVRTQAPCIGSAESQPLNPPGESRSRGSWRLRQRMDSTWQPTLTHGPVSVH